MTRWLPVVGYVGRYEVSDDGQVRSLPRVGRLNQIRVLKPSKNGRGYWRVDLWSGEGSRSWRSVHVLMLEAFVGPRPQGELALHNDDDRDNNTLPNLRWGTRSDNAADALANGRDAAANGNHHNTSKTHCKWGHPFEGENLRRLGNRRICRACDRRHVAEYRARARAS